MRVAATAVCVGSWLGQIGWLAAPGGVVIPHLYNPLLIYLHLLFNLHLPRLLSLGTPVSTFCLARFSSDHKILLLVLELGTQALVRGQEMPGH